jgi:hypothetical protein
MKILFLAIHRAIGAATFKKTASTMKYRVATRKIVDLKIRFTWGLKVCIRSGVTAIAVSRITRHVGKVPRFGAASWPA